MATITMDAAKVIAAAEATIEHIEAERKRRDEEVIAEYMQPRTALFGLIKLKARTREEAIKALDESDNMWGWRSGYAWRDLEQARKLLKLAKLGDPVVLNEEDVRVLF